MNRNVGKADAAYLRLLYHQEMSSSLGEKLVHLSLEIEDRTKSAELLQQLINDQTSRH